MREFLFYYFIGFFLGFAILLFVGALFCIIHSSIIDFNYRRNKNKKRMLFDERSVD